MLQIILNAVFALVGIVYAVEQPGLSGSDKFAQASNAYTAGVNAEPLPAFLKTALTSTLFLNIVITGVVSVCNTLGAFVHAPVVVVTEPTVEPTADAQPAE